MLSNGLELLLGYLVKLRWKIGNKKGDELENSKTF